MPLPPEPETAELAAELAMTAAPTEVALDSEMLATLSPEDRKILEELDMDGSGKVELAEILGLLRHHRENKAHMGKMFKTFFGVISVLLVLLCVNCVATFMVVETSKENKVKGDALVSASTGKTVDTANSDMGVDADGKLVQKTSANGSRLLAAKKTPIKTTPSQQKVDLASSLPDKTLMGLDEITVYSDKGHTLQIKVHGFSRVPVLNSKCGNVVHFYTAWKGRITLDSTDMSFDEATAKEFKNAGFSLAVGGMGGRRLAKKSKSDGFFKHMEAIKKSGKWKCAGVPLPTMTDLNVQKNSDYYPCATKTDTSKPKRSLEMCESRFGGLVPGAALLEKKHALATRSKTARLRAQLKKSTIEVIYVKTKTTLMRSAKYQVQFDTYANHVGQELVSILDRTSKASVGFQIVSGEARSHCKKEGTDVTGKSVEKAKADKKVDSDMHFEFLETVEEDGKVLRHFRMMTSDAFTKYMAGSSATRPKDAYTEYWDIADTLTPYRILSGDGSMMVFESLVAKCTDDEITAALKKRTSIALADQFVCSGAEKKADLRPTMTSPYTDLTRNDLNYYTTKVYGNQAKAEAIANDAEDTSDKAKFARYLVNSKDTLAMPDFCFTHCKANVEKVKAELKKGDDTCKTKSLPNALECLESSGMDKCSSSEFVSNYRGECDKTKNMTRRLEEEEDYTESAPEVLVPARTLPDGTQEIDLSKSHPQLKATLGARLLFNLTKRHEDAYSSEAIVDSPVESRRLLSSSCNSKFGRVTWMGDGWCMKWEFKPKGFSLTVKWGLVGGSMGLSIGCAACVNLLEFWAVPPPLKVDFCVGGEISVTAVRACPDIPLTISGKVYWSIAGVIDLSVLSITLAKIELGIFAAVASFNKETSCWWVSGEGRRRRRWWSSRRRNWRACNYRAACDIKVGAYVEITYWMAKLRFEDVYWVKHKCMTLSVMVYVYEFWKVFWAKWKKVYSTEVMRYQF